ncbi:2OG-Fe(II) oxygenase [Corallococcus interemptor]|uniref:2OG-Fe(II) oxygenase n=1 Tax=Corallococcus TaxID=83461 RepID=UPI0035D4EB2F
MVEEWKSLRNRSHVPFLVIPGVFSQAECRAIIDICSSHPAKSGQTWDGKAYTTNNDIRRLDTAYVPRSEQTQWVFDRMDKVFFKTAEYWGLDVRETTEDLKYLIYREGSHFTKWHADIGEDYSNLRKISMSVELCDSSEYDGAHLQIFPSETGHVAGPERTAGTAVVFPSHRLHRVTEVTRGTRHALVNWISGPPLR